MTTTNVPSDQFDDLKRDVEDATRYSNSETVFTNRVGKQIRPISLQAQDIADNLAAADQALANSGFIPKGDFTTGGTVEAKNEVFSDGTDYWRYDGALPFTVTAGSSSTPTGVGAWINVSDGTLRSQLAISESTVLIGGAEAGNLASRAVDPRDYGAIGDGAANDTAAFEAMEASEKGRVVNLLGKTYLLDKQFSGCEYTNGSFIVDSKTYKVDKSESQGATLSSATLRSKWSDARYSVPDGLFRSTTILGDSISHGAFQGNLYMDSWVNIFKRMLNAQTGCVSYGHAPLLTLGSGGNTSREVHSVSFSSGNAWDFQESGSGGEDAMQGLALESSQAGDSITLTVPTFQQKVRVWYMKSASSGTFSYSVNGGSPTNVSTGGPDDIAASVTFDMTDNGYGETQIVLSVVSGTVRISGVGYETPASNPAAGNVLNNFSQSGRRLRDVSQAALESACKSSTLILALGHNDQADVQSNSTYRDEFIQRIDWIIEYCLFYNCSLIVADFCWSQSLEDNICRQNLRRAAIETRGQYIPLPDYMYRDELLFTEYSDSYYQVGTLEYFSDTSHPNKAGAKWIAETIAADIGLSVRSKKEAIIYHDWAFPIQLDSAEIFENSQLSFPYNSLVKRVGDSYQFSLRVKKTGGGTVPAGDYTISKSFSSASVRQFQMFTTSGWSQHQPITLTDTNDIGFAVKINNLQGEISIRSITPYLGSIDYSFSMPADPTVDRN